jgi:hypothetical protein
MGWGEPIRTFGRLEIKPGTLWIGVYLSLCDRGYGYSALIKRKLYFKFFLIDKEIQNGAVAKSYTV